MKNILLFAAFVSGLVASSHAYAADLLVFNLYRFRLDISAFWYQSRQPALYGFSTHYDQTRQTTFSTVTIVVQDGKLSARDTIYLFDRVTFSAEDDGTGGEGVNYIQLGSSARQPARRIFDGPMSDPFFQAGEWVYFFGEGIRSEAVDSSTYNPVPEPATWAMQIAGFGLTGAVLRRRRGLRVHGASRT